MLLVMQHSFYQGFSAVFRAQTYLLLCFILSGLLQVEDQYCVDSLLLFVVVYSILLS